MQGFLPSCLLHLPSCTPIPFRFPSVPCLPGLPARMWTTVSTILQCLLQLLTGGKPSTFLLTVPSHGSTQPEMMPISINNCSNIQRRKKCHDPQHALSCFWHEVWAPKGIPDSEVHRLILSLRVSSFYHRRFCGYHLTQNQKVTELYSCLAKVPKPFTMISEQA